MTVMGSLFFLFAIYAFALVYLSSKTPGELFLNLEENLEPQSSFSLLIPLVDERENIPLLETALDKLVYPKGKVEILIINNGKSLTEKELEPLLKYPNTTFLQLEEQNKKEAIATGVEKASNEYVVMLDADGVPHPLWLQSLDQTIRLHYPQAIIGLVTSASEKQDEFSQHFMALDFLSLQLTQLRLFFLGKPGLANGTNLCFRKEAFKTIEKKWKAIPTASGDDVFLIQLLHKNGMKITLNRYREGMVATPLPQDISEFIAQRIRWGAKTKFYQGFFLKAFALLLLIMNVGILVGLALVFTRWFTLGEFLILLALKSSADYLFLRKGFEWFSLQHTKPHFLTSAFLYPFYLVFAGLNAIFGKYTWKGKSYNA